MLGRGPYLLLAVLGVSGCSIFATEDDTSSSEPAANGEAVADGGADAIDGIPYTVAIEGSFAKDLKNLLRGVSESERLMERPPPSALQVRRRAEGDLERFRQALRSRGHYASEAGVRVDRDASPVSVVFTVDPGPVYRFRDIQVEMVGEAPGYVLPAIGEIGLAAGRPAESQKILDAEGRLVDDAKADGFALAAIGKRKAVVNHDEQVMDLVLRLEPGPKTVFGDVIVAGLQDVEAPFVRRRLPWMPGEAITPARITEGRTDLLESELFATTRIELGSSLAEDGTLPVRVDVTERDHRTIGVGARFRTDEGLGANVTFEHRNLLGRGERVTAEIDGSGLGFFIRGGFEKPDFQRRDQSFIASTEAAIESTDGFDSQSIGAAAGFKRQFSEELSGTAELAYRHARIEGSDGAADDFDLLSFPVSLRWDRSDDLLDPSEGGRLTVQNEPFVDLFNSNVTFNKTEVAYTQYWQVSRAPRLILAGRAGVGTLFGAERDQVPADELFFAGGGGSVRGFGFQLAGDLGDDDDPIGGRSLLELSGEIRANITETIGAVAFVDAGSAFESSVPTFDEELFVGVGTGVRYFTPIGPLRFDVAVPVNPRDSDDAFQIYISIGQAF